MVTMPSEREARLRAMVAQRLMECSPLQFPSLVSAARVAGEVASLVDAEIAKVQFRPLGDNHHNALACPYCTPPVGGEGSDA